MKTILNPLTGKSNNIVSVLMMLAAQEGCDGEPYDQMQAAAEYILFLEECLDECITGRGGMTKSDLKKKVNLLLMECVNKERVDGIVDHIEKSGCVDFSEHGKESWGLAKLIACAVGKDIEHSYKPISKEGMDQLKNIYINI